MDVTLPFRGDTVTVREMTGAEEDLLGDEKKMRDGRAINHMLAACSGLDYNTVVGLMQSDRLAILLAVRMETYGPDIKGTVTCPNKQCHNRWNVGDFSLSKVSVYKTQRSQFGPGGEYQGKLSNGCGITLRMLTGNDERSFAAVSADERLTLMLLIPLIHVALPDGTILQENDKKRWLKNLGARYRDEMREFIADHQLGYDTRFEVFCPECGNQLIGCIEGLPNFFSPSSSTIMS